MQVAFKQLEMEWVPEVCTTILEIAQIRGNPSNYMIQMNGTYFTQL